MFKSYTIQATVLTGNIPYWYHSVLTNLHELEKYHERKPYTRMAKNMDIWRVPLAKLETTTILEYEVSEDKQVLLKP